MCVTSLLCGPWADLWPFNGLYSERFSLYIKVYLYHKSAHGPHRRDVTQILCKVSCFLLKSFHFRRLITETIGFFPCKSLYFEINVTQQCRVHQCLYFELVLPVVILSKRAKILHQKVGKFYPLLYGVCVFFFEGGRMATNLPPNQTNINCCKVLRF